ncbi:MAG: SUF system Fe-S cluster assembly regulator, partial [Coxiellaceae bacterium]|nr:SUF system Fe-S cluster assembly regulator [Coxiellaceae bacterium]
MIRLSKITDYGVLIMRCLAQANARQMSAREIAQITRVNLPTVSKVLKLLVGRGLVRSTRGSSGGYQLVNTPEQTSLAEIIRALDGDVSLTECCSQ